MPILTEKGGSGGLPAPRRMYRVPHDGSSRRGNSSARHNFARPDPAHPVPAHPIPAKPNPARRDSQKHPAAAPPDGPRSPFEVLGIPRGASSAQIKAAYRQLCARYHPDVRANAAEKAPEASTAALPPDSFGDADPESDPVEVFLEIQEAYRILNDRWERARWEADAAPVDHEPGSPWAAMPQEPWAALLAPPSPARIVGQSVAGALRLTVAWASQVNPVLLCSALFLLLAMAILTWRDRSALNPPAEKSSAGTPVTASLQSPGSSPQPGRRVLPPRQAAERAPIQFAAPAVLDPDPTDLANQDPVNQVPANPELANQELARLTPPMQDPQPTDSHIPPLAHPPASLAVAPRNNMSPTSIHATAHAANEWRGHWTAYCIPARAASLYLGWLHLEQTSVFRWRDAATGASGERRGLRVVSDSPGSPAARLEEPGGSVLATLQTGNHRRTLTWQSQSPAPSPGCANWTLLGQGSPALSNSRWVLPAEGEAAAGSLAPEYVELRLRRTQDGIDAHFTGRYRVPSPSIPAEIRFPFTALESGADAAAWRDEAGSSGVVTLVPLGQSRLAIFWRRLRSPDGRPRLSSGVSVLERIE